VQYIAILFRYAIISSLKFQTRVINKHMILKSIKRSRICVNINETYTILCIIPILIIKRNSWGRQDIRWKNAKRVGYNIMISCSTCRSQGGLLLLSHW